ncbi:MAG: hypothetical protein AAF311_11835 [Pseudomonadota bacterium]
MNFGGMELARSPFVMGLVVGGLSWVIFDSLFFGLLAAAATGLLMRRDAREDEEDRL